MDPYLYPKTNGCAYVLLAVERAKMVSQLLIMNKYMEVLTRTPHKQLLKACLVLDNVTPSDNRSLIYFRLVGQEGSLHNPHTATTELVVVGKL